MNTLFFKKFLSVKKNMRNGERERNPERDWRVLLLAACLMFFIAVLIGVYTFLDSERQSSAGVSTGGVIRSIDTDMLHDIVTRYEGKAKELESLRKNDIDVDDPSR